MDYKIEMHAHTSEVSACGKIPGANGQKCGKWGRKMRKRPCNFRGSPV